MAITVALLLENVPETPISGIYFFFVCWNISSIEVFQAYATIYITQKQLIDILSEY